MDDLFADMVAALREGQRAMDVELRPLLEAQPPDWSMLMRLRDVADAITELAGDTTDLVAQPLGRVGKLQRP